MDNKRNLTLTSLWLDQGHLLGKLKTCALVLVLRLLLAYTHDRTAWFQSRAPRALDDSDTFLKYIWYFCFGLVCFLFSETGLLCATALVVLDLALIDQASLNFYIIL